MLNVFQLRDTVLLTRNAFHINFVWKISALIDVQLSDANLAMNVLKELVTLSVNPARHRKTVEKESSATLIHALMHAM